MLVLALGATLVGFVLLVGALLSGLLWLAVACIIVCVIGVGFLVADLIGIGRSGRPTGETESDGNQSGRSAGNIRDRSGQPDLEEDPEGQSLHDPGGTASDNEATGRIPRISRRDTDDPPTEEIRMDGPS